MPLQWMVAFFGMVALIAGVIAAYYVISFLVLRGVSALLPLSGRRKRKNPRQGSDPT